MLRGTGSLSGEKKQYLDDMSKQLGLPQVRGGGGAGGLEGCQLVGGA
jgi:hypothetical protein